VIKSAYPSEDADTSVDRDGYVSDAWFWDVPLARDLFIVASREIDDVHGVIDRLTSLDFPVLFSFGRRWPLSGRLALQKYKPSPL
jgi:hypothetical protein